MDPSPRSRYARERLLGTACLALCVALPLSGCITREVKEKVYDRGGIKVLLREHHRGTETIARGFEHPVQIASTRLQHILGAIDIRGREKQLAGIRTAFPPEEVEKISNALSASFAIANPNQELAVSIITRVRQHGIFDRRYLTSFVAYVNDDLLFLHFSRVDWKQPERSKKTDLPEPRVDEHPMKFKVMPAEGMYQEGIYAVSLPWRDSMFQRPLRKLESGERGNRTVLMERPTRAPTRPPERTGGLGNLSPDQLRALADLEEARQRGEVTQGRYERRRKEILSGD